MSTCDVALESEWISPCSTPLLPRALNSPTSQLLNSLEQSDPQSLNPSTQRPSAAPQLGRYGLLTDASGWYAAMYKPYHLIGLELGVSVASVALRREPTGCPTGWRADVVAVAKRDLQMGEALDGEGGYTVWGKVVSASRSVSQEALPLGLAHGCTVRRAIGCGETLRWSDVEFGGAGLEQSIALRREMEASLKPLY